MGDDCDILVGVCYAYVGDAVLKERLAVVMVAEVYLVLKDLIEKRPYGKPLFPQVFAADK